MVSGIQRKQAVTLEMADVKCCEVLALITILKRNVQWNPKIETNNHERN
jgi:hypothetical protein